jgi:hypothetical protein
MEQVKKEYIYRDGARFEVRPDGLFYAPEKKSGPAKHDCPDCYFCQWCADLRCVSCRREAPAEKDAKCGNPLPCHCGGTAS